MLQKMIRALSKRRGVVLASSPEPEELPNGDAVFRQGLAVALGPEVAGELLAELDYQERIARMERLAVLRRRGLAIQGELQSLP